MDTRCFLHGPGRGQFAGEWERWGIWFPLAGSLPDFPTTAARYEGHLCYLIFFFCTRRSEHSNGARTRALWPFGYQKNLGEGARS